MRKKLGTEIGEKQKSIIGTVVVLYLGSMMRWIDLHGAANLTFTIFAFSVTAIYGIGSR